MIRKVLLGLIGLSILIAAASVAVFASAYALFAVLISAVGVAGAAGIVALVALVIVLGAVLAILLKFRSPPARAAEQDSGLVGKLFTLAKEKPLLSASVAAAAAVIAFRNPRLVTALLTGILAGKASPKQ